MVFKTAQEIFDIKRSWIYNCSEDQIVRTHSDSRQHHKVWCKTNLDKWQWNVKTYVDSYEDEFRFQDEASADLFKQHVKMMWFQSNHW